MKKAVLIIFGILGLGCFQLHAQTEEETPVDGVALPMLLKQRTPLPYAPVRESDIFWSKRVWRLVDTREKMNLYWVYPPEPLAKILIESAINGDLQVYQDDRFTQKLSTKELQAQMNTIDTIASVSIWTQLDTTIVVENAINYESVKRYRIKEDWFFDSHTSTLGVRILGIAPLIEVYDDLGNFRFEKPLFWIYYPAARKSLATHKVYREGNDAAMHSWEDMLEMRYFSSYIIKASNVHDQRIQDYLTGVDALLEGEKIKNEIFNFEGSLWAY